MRSDGNIGDLDLAAVVHQGALQCGGPKIRKFLIASHTVGPTGFIFYGYIGLCPGSVLHIRPVTLTLALLPTRGHP